MEQKIRLGIMEDTRSVVEALRLYFELSEEVELVFTSDRLEDIVRLCREHTPDLLLMDINLGYFTGLDALKLVKESVPEVQVLMFTVQSDDENLFEAITLGASGYLLKGTPAAELETAIVDTYRGGAPMAPLLNARLLQAFRKGRSPHRAVEGLTPRENDILQALVRGLSYKQVAAELHISLGTVRTHIEHLYGKMQVNSKAEAVAKFLQGLG